MAKTRPFLKWAGNKYRCLDKIMPYFPQASRLIEPFAGSAAVFLNTEYDSYLLAEENLDLINLYQLLQKDGAVFIDYCREYFTQNNNCKNRYYHFREEFNHCKNLRKKAALFLYLNRHGYNGLCRYNQQGKYNVPFGRYSKPYFPQKEMMHFVNKCRQVTFVQSDFRETLSKAVKGDLIYCDPPYVPRSKTSYFTSYTQTKFGEPEQLLLLELTQDCLNRGITVIISNHDTDFTRHHYRNGEIISFPVQRTISCVSSQREPVNELLAIFKP